VRDDAPKPKQYAMHIISGTSNVLDNFASKGVTFKKLWGTSRTPDGINISRKLGFKETPLPPDGKTLAFELEIETSNNPLLQDYKALIRNREKPT
jgi:hypothetical protein